MKKSVSRTGFFTALLKAHTTDWYIHANFGKIAKSEVSERFRFTQTATFMGIDNATFLEIAAKASNTTINCIKERYSGFNAFEQGSYESFIGLSNLPNQKLNYAEIDSVGAQTNINEIEKKPNVRRVMLIGNSTAFGIGATSIKNNITSKLLEYLNSKENNLTNNKIKWEIVNLSFVSSKSFSELNLINKYVSFYMPDYIIQLSGFNDIFAYLNSDSTLFSFNFSKEIKDFLYSSNIKKTLYDLCNYFLIFHVIRRIIKLKSQKEEKQIYNIY